MSKCDYIECLYHDIKNDLLENCSWAYKPSKPNKLNDPIFYFLNTGNISKSTKHEDCYYYKKYLKIKTILK